MAAGRTLATSLGGRDEHPAHVPKLVGDVPRAALAPTPLLALRCVGPTRLVGGRRVGGRHIGGPAAVAAPAVEAHLDARTTAHTLDDLEEVSSWVGNDQQIVNRGHRGLAYGDRGAER